MPYGYRVVALWNNKPAGLIGLASTRERAKQLKWSQQQSARIVREKWSIETQAVVRAEEAAGRIPKGLPLSMVAKAGGKRRHARAKSKAAKPTKRRSSSFAALVRDAQRRIRARRR